jgi:alkyl hydroperoxide reductase subunit F
MAADQLITPDVEREIRTALADLTHAVRLVYFTQEHACGPCREQQALLEALVPLSDRLTLETYDLVRDAATAREYGVDKVPATAVVGEVDRAIRFFGVTAGYEFSSLLEAIRMASRGTSGLEPDLAHAVALIDRPVHIEVMVTLTCPYCPAAVHVAQQMAMASDLVRADMVNAAEFPQLVQRYDVHGVPRTVINGVPAFEGALPAPAAILEVLAVGNPAEYERLTARLRAHDHDREHRAVPADPDHEYDLVIVGAGAAAMSAAVYAARKNLDVALLGDRTGGQITDTASVENWLGFPSIGGAELADLFRHHVEHYHVAERLGVTVDVVERVDGAFDVRTHDGDRYRARAVVYAAGKRYRRLGEPGEDRFVGRGIAFCATCDAPLYAGKRVAVVGGGNSAFTAVRDLASFASEIHVFNILPDWQADALLVEESRHLPHVHLHPATRVVEFLGKDTLTGVRVESVDGSHRTDVLAEGVFLEIGLVPNSHPVRKLATLTDAGEIVVARDQSTDVPGLFAAGDVTDEPEKQIVVAAGAGAKAALAAYRYLAASRRGVTADAMAALV